MRERHFLPETKPFFERYRVSPAGRKAPNGQELLVLPPTFSLRVVLSPSEWFFFGAETKGDPQEVKAVEPAPGSLPRGRESLLWAKGSRGSRELLLGRARVRERATSRLLELPRSRVSHGRARWKGSSPGGNPGLASSPREDLPPEVRARIPENPPRSASHSRALLSG